MEVTQLPVQKVEHMKLNAEEEEEISGNSEKKSCLSMILLNCTAAQELMLKNYAMY